MKKPALPLLALAALLVLPTTAEAHPGGPHVHGFLSGFEHPLLGLDHLLAMIAVGLWAAQIGGRARWAVPATFVLVMALGGALGFAGVSLPHVESGIAASVLVLGLLIALAARAPLAAAVPLVAIFAAFHGYAHGAEVPAGASSLLYAGGFLLATAALHGAGVATGLFVSRATAAPVVRFAGAAIALAGVCLALG